MFKKDSIRDSIDTEMGNHGENFFRKRVSFLVLEFIILISFFFAGCKREKVKNISLFKNTEKIEISTARIKKESQYSTVSIFAVCA